MYQLGIGGINKIKIKKIIIITGRSQTFGTILNKISPSYELDFVQDVHVERVNHLC